MTTTTAVKTAFVRITSHRANGKVKRAMAGKKFEWVHGQYYRVDESMLGTVAAIKGVFKSPGPKTEPSKAEQKRTDKLKNLVEDFLKSKGAVPTSSHYGWNVQTPAGLLWVNASGSHTIFTHFDEPSRGKILVDCNPYSGKWNFHFPDDWTQEDCATEFILAFEHMIQRGST